MHSALPEVPEAAPPRRIGEDGEPVLRAEGGKGEQPIEPGADSGDEADPPASETGGDDRGGLPPLNPGDDGGSGDSGEDRTPPRDDVGGTGGDGPPGDFTDIPDGGYVVIVGESQWWQGGFNGELTVLNNDQPPLEGWTVVCTFDSFEVLHVWNAVWSKDGAVNTFVSYDWNGALAPGESATLGFTADGVLEAKTQASCTLNGTPVAAVPDPMQPSKPGGGEPAPEEPEVEPAGVLASQIGHLPGARKRATVPTAETEPLAWSLLDAGGTVVASGSTTVFGPDAASGDHVHLVDYSSVTTPGSGYVLKVGELSSHPFDIGAGIYSAMKYDALAYFYHNRSGIQIELPWALEEQWERPAGHLSDSAVPCYPDSGCDYSLDVTGGWYDAGDHGKYVVNGGISAWTLLNLWERKTHLGKSTAAFGDGTLMIPESSNGVADLLDEARWQVEFLLKMQVPEDQDMAGMAHHKMHDAQWTPLGTAPHEDTMERYLYPPSTAATLNLAAVAAQASRVFLLVDPSFALTCLQAAEKAWAAAELFPEEYATQQFTGGGPYDDDDVTDERYWAAVELFVSTSAPQYLEAAMASPYWLTVPTTLDKEGAGPMNWKFVQGLGTITLALVGSTLPEADRLLARQAVIEAAAAFVAIQDTQGYGTPYYNVLDGKYPWGSNSFVLNEMIALALAFDFTSDPKYRHAVEESMDYLLGRNPKGQCYVTGHGEAPLKYPHHRFWAYQADITYPKAPPGAISGGPNSGLQDPWVQAKGLPGCTPAKCFLDHIESWSTNEITINWNAPFAWVLAWLDEVASQQ